MTGRHATGIPDRDRWDDQPACGLAQAVGAFLAAFGVAAAIGAAFIAVAYGSR